MLTELQICEAISAWFEPKPDLPRPLHYVELMEAQSKGLCKQVGFRWFSPKGLWVDGTKEWESAYDYYHDEAANARLRDRLLVETDTPNMLALRGEDDWMTIQRDIYRFVLRRFDDGASVSGMYREAWVRQFCKFAGIEVAHVD